MADDEPALPPSFFHIHCSSRFDRSAAELEEDLDQWMEKAQIITLTEVSNNRQASRMREKGWEYANAKQHDGQDECGIAWDLTHWTRTQGWVVKLSNHRYYELNGRPAKPVYALTVLLRRKKSKHKMLVSVAHLPEAVEGDQGWNTEEARWRARKEAYISSNVNWKQAISKCVRQVKPHAVMITADWNLNLKEYWVRDFLQSKWGMTDLELAWKVFPTESSSFQANKLLDGTLYWGLDPKDYAWPAMNPTLLGQRRANNHRPMQEEFWMLTKKEARDLDWSSEGDNELLGTPWYGFGDYEDDEIYALQRATES